MPARRHERAFSLKFFAIGLGLMYFFDPRYGRRRRNGLRDKIRSKLKHFQRLADKTARDFAHRARGIYAETGHLFHEESAPDEIVFARVRAKLGRYVSHAHAVEVSVDDGTVTLAGAILEEEVRGVISAIRNVPGVKNVEAILEAHRHPGRVPSLQGSMPRSGERAALLQESWNPTTRAFVAATGAALIGAGLANRSLPGIVLALCGTAALTRALANEPIDRLAKESFHIAPPPPEMIHASIT